MTTSVSHPPTKPTLYSTFRPAVACTLATAGGGGLWWEAAHASFLPTLGVHLPPPDPYSHIAVLGLGCAWAVSAVVAVARANYWHTQLEDQRVYEKIARLLRVPLTQRRARMRVAVREGRVPVDVRVRVEHWTLPLDERAQAALVRAFAEATRAPGDKVRITEGRRSVRLFVQGTDPYTPPVPRPEPVALLADKPEPVLPPVPVQPADDQLREQLAEAMRGALGNDKVEVEVTDTYDDGYPAQVWVTYPARLSSTVTDALGRMRAVLEQNAPSRADEWSVRLVGTKCRVVLDARTDPLAGFVDLPEIEKSPDLHKGVVIGVTEAGGPWRLPLMGGLHTLVAGASQSGKGSVLWNIVRALGPMIADGRARLWIVDPKGGMEFAKAEPIAHRFAVTIPDAERLLADLREVMAAKARAVAASGRRKIDVPTTEEPLDLLIVDELANVTGLAGKAGDGIADNIAALCSMGRAPAVTVIGALQDPRKETFRHRNLFTAAVALRLREAGETNLVLGQGARAQGALADLIPVKYPGIGYVISDEHAMPERVRTAFVSDEEIDAIVARATPPMGAPPIGSPIPAAQQDELVVTTRAHPSASNQPRKRASRARTKPEPARTAEGTPVRIIALNTFPVRARFDGDPDPVTIHGWENSPDDNGRVLVTYQYDGEGEKVTDVEDSETVTVEG